MVWELMEQTADRMNTGVLAAGKSRARGIAATVVLSLLLTSLTSCIAARKSNLGAVSIGNFTISVWDSSDVANILSPSPTGTVNINPGEKVVLTWNVAGATGITIVDGSGAAPSITALSGNRAVVIPATTTTYTLTATGAGGPLSASVSVTVNPPPVISNFAASATSILAGQSTTLSWSVSNARSVTLYAYDPSQFGKPGDHLFGTMDVTGVTTLQVAPAMSTEYELIATYNSDGGGTGGSPEAAVLIQVTTVPAPAVTLQATNTSIVPGASTTLTWSVTNSAYVTNLTLQAVDASNPAPGLQTDVTQDLNLVVSPGILTTYTLVATNSANVQASSNPVTITVTSCPAPRVSQFSANPVATGTHQSVSLTANFDGGVTGDAGTGTIDNSIGLVTSGSPVATPMLSSSTTFTLTVKNSCGASTYAKTRVPVGDISYFGGYGLGLYFALAGDSKGNLYSASDISYTGCIFRIDPTGKSTTISGDDGGSCDKFGWQDGPVSSALFNDPWGVAVDSAANLYIVDSTNNAIRVLSTTDDTVSTLAGDPTANNGKNHFQDGQGTNALFYLPRGVAIDARGNLYVADSGNNVIRMVDSAGNVTTIAGAGPSINNQTGSGYQDATGRQALFNNPIGITLSSDGSLYVVDAGNNVIRKITLPDAVVTTVAGSAGQLGYSDGPGSTALFADIQAIASDSEGNLYVPDNSHKEVDTSKDVNNYVIRRLRPQSDGTYWVDTIIGAQGARMILVNTSLPVPLPGNFQIDGAGILADPKSGNLFITAAHGIYMAPY